MSISALVLVALLTTAVADPHYVVDTKCPDKPADIVFVLDGSGSEGNSNFQSELHFVQNFSKNFNIGQTHAQISVVQFATAVKSEFRLKDHTTSASLTAAISRIHWLNGETYTGDALNYVERNSFISRNGGRSHVDRIVIVLTDGQSNHPNETAAAAKRLHDKRITVVAIGIGSAVNPDELRAIASNSKHVFTVPNFSALNTIHADITDTTCKLCDSTPIDLAFLLDASGSESNTNFGSQKNFTKLVAGELNYNGDGTHIALVTFSTGANPVFAFTKYHDLAHIQQAIDHAPFQHGESYTHAGLQYLTDHTFKQARYGAKHVAIVLTDGRSNEDVLTRIQAGRLRATGTLVIAVGIGSNVDQLELKSIASSDKNVLNVASASLLSKIHDKVIDLICESKNVFTTTHKPTTTTTTTTTKKPTTTTTKKPTTTTTKKPTTTTRKPTTHTSTTTPKPRLVCGPKPADILFLLDNSDSEGDVNFAKETDFVKEFANRFVVDPHHNQFSVLTFSSAAKNEFWFNTYHNRHDVTEAIKRIQYVGTGTNTAAGLHLARTQSFTASHGSRPNAQKIAIVITDGRSKSQNDTLKEAEALKKSGVTVISIGIGFAQGDQELHTIASNPRYVFSVQNFDALKTIQHRVIETTCTPIGPTTTHPATTRHHGHG